jgi:hypothetical protein
MYIAIFIHVTIIVFLMLKSKFLPDEDEKKEPLNFASNRNKTKSVPDTPEK